MTPHVLVKIGPKPYRLRYDINAVSDVEETAGIGLGEILSKRNMAFHSVRLLFWAGLKWADRNLTPTKAGELIQQYCDENGGFEAAYGALQAKIMDALSRSGVVKLTPVEPDDDLEGGAPGNAPTGAEATPTQTSEPAASASIVG